MSEAVTSGKVAGTDYSSTCSTAFQLDVYDALRVRDKTKLDDPQALTSLIYAHITPYGTFNLDLQQRLQLEAA